MAHNFMESNARPNGNNGEPKAVVERFLDAIWMERGLSENTLGAYRADLLALSRSFWNAD